MSPRRNRPSRGQKRIPGPDQDAGPPASGSEQRETGPDGQWAVRRISGTAAVKRYSCPGCAQDIPPGTPHVVAWPIDEDSASNVAERRHWHSTCWERRLRRGVRHPRKT